MKTQILIFDEEKNIRLASDKPYFEITDERGNHIILTETQLEELKYMISEMLQMINKRDY